MALRAVVCGKRKTGRPVGSTKQRRHNGGCHHQEQQNRCRGRTTTQRRRSNAGYRRHEYEHNTDQDQANRPDDCISYHDIILPCQAHFHQPETHIGPDDAKPARKQPFSKPEASMAPSCTALLRLPLAAGANTSQSAPEDPAARGLSGCARRRERLVYCEPCLFV